MFEDYASPSDFPDWFFAEIDVSGQRRVASLFHVASPLGPVVYWFDDHEHPQRVMPLLTSMHPENLGDYGAFLQLGENMRSFVAVCKLLDDLPDPLYAMQVIRWMNRNAQRDEELDAPDLVRRAFQALRAQTVRRRADFDFVMSVLTGSDPRQQGMPESVTRTSG